MIDYAAILTLRYESSEWTLNGDDYSGLTWLSDSPKPTKAKLDGEWESVKAELETKAQAKATAKAALLERLGITQDEAKLLIG
jgi:hypothetical protein